MRDVFCDNCGTSLKEGAAFCHGCGQKVTPQPVQLEQVGETEVLNQEWQQPQQGWQQPQQEWQQPQQGWQQPQQEWQQPQPEWQAPLQPEWENNAGEKKGKAGKIVAVIVILLLVVGAGAYLINLLFGGGHEDAVNDYFDAFMKADGEKLFEISMPKDIQEEYCDAFDTDKDDAIEQVEDMLNQIWDAVDSEGASVECKITCSENVNKLDELENDVEDAGIEDLEDFRDYMDDNLGDYGLDVEKITNAYAVEVEVIAESEDEEQTQNMIVFSYKYKGKWYVFGGNALY